MNNRSFAMLALAGAVFTVQTDAQSKAAKKQAGPAASAAGPSLVKTLDFVTQAFRSDSAVNLNIKGTNGWESTDSMRTAFSEEESSCRIAITMTDNKFIAWAKGASPTQSSRTDSWRLDLSDIDPASVTSIANEASSDQNGSMSAWGYSIQIATHDLVPSIDHEWGNNKEHKEQSGKFRMIVSDNKTTQMIVHALSHAIELCGGKKSAF